MNSMRIRSFVLCLLACPFGIAQAPSAQTAAGDRIQLTLDTSEADQVLAVLARRQAGTPVAEAEWQALFDTVPYQRLKQREKAIGEQFHEPGMAFSDEDFRKFVLSNDILQRAASLRDTLVRWKQADLRQSAERALRYLPDAAIIRATVYPTIKPRENSFVWDVAKDPAIFLYLNPDVTRAKFENTVAHELHHIGLGSLGSVYSPKIAGLPERARTAAEYMAGFGEGMAMLAAAGGPDVDPHAASTPAEHDIWEKALAAFNTDVPAVNSFFLDILDGTLTGDAIDTKGGSFFGSHQGPWYTVGYKMAAIVEKRFGRPALIRTMLDYRCLPALYNRAAREQNAAGNAQLPLWSETVLSQVQAGACGVP